MANIEVRIDGVSDVIAALETIKAKIDAATRDGTQRSGEMLQRYARANFHGAHGIGYHHGGGDSPNTVTGHLQSSIIFLNPVLAEGPAKYQTRIGPTARYGRVIELGAKIDAKFAPFLAWFDAQEGHLVRRKSVVIPPYPYFRPARSSLPPKMQSIFYAAWSGAWSN